MNNSKAHPKSEVNIVIAKTKKPDIFKKKQFYVEPEIKLQKTIM
jgi:hypothetical protein